MKIRISGLSGQMFRRFVEPGVWRTYADIFTGLWTASAFKVLSVQYILSKRKPLRNLYRTAGTLWRIVLTINGNSKHIVHLLRKTVKKSNWWLLSAWTNALNRSKFLYKCALISELLSPKKCVFRRFTWFLMDFFPHFPPTPFLFIFPFPSYHHPSHEHSIFLIHNPAILSGGLRREVVLSQHVQALPEPARLAGCYVQVQ